MPILRVFERRLGGLVEGLFSKAFRSGVQPVEIAKLIMREMEAGRSVGVSEVWALQVKNALMSETFYLDYNYKSGTVEEAGVSTLLPVLSYKVEF